MPNNQGGQGGSQPGEKNPGQQTQQPGQGGQQQGGQPNQKPGQQQQSPGKSGEQQQGGQNQPTSSATSSPHSKEARRLAPGFCLTAGASIWPITN